MLATKSSWKTPNYPSRYDLISEAVVSLVTSYDKADHWQDSFLKNKAIFIEKIRFEESYNIINPLYTHLGNQAVIELIA